MICKKGTIGTVKTLILVIVVLVISIGIYSRIPRGAEAMSQCAASRGVCVQKGTCNGAIIALPCTLGMECCLKIGEETPKNQLALPKESGSSKTTSMDTLTECRNYNKLTEEINSAYGIKLQREKMSEKDRLVCRVLKNKNMLDEIIYDTECAALTDEIANLPYEALETPEEYCKKI